MSSHQTLRHMLIAAAASTVLLATAAPAVASGAAAPAGATAGVSAAGTRAEAGHLTDGYAALHRITVLAAERIATADLVAAAKWGTDSPIDDPAREQVVLDTVRRLAVEAGTDPERVVAVFRDQIEANKTVQRGLHRKWTADPADAPATRPDLTEVRKEINRINSELVQALAASAEVRSASYCRGLLGAAALRTGHEKRLDRLHAKALVRALPSVCATR
jgi:chorismate mutase